MTTMMTVRPAAAADQAYLETSMREAFGGTAVAVHGALIELADTQAVIAEDDGRPAGLLTYHDDTQGGWEVVTLLATTPGRGAGGALLNWVEHEATRAQRTRVWLITTNDNTGALRFYQRRGYDLVRLGHGDVDRMRLLKPGIPATNDGIPIRHELELELRLADDLHHSRRIG
jgi:ribosomal protein S18 acetylase RimI-like enzyme